MYIKGNENGTCNMCGYGFFDAEKNTFLCMLKNEETKEDETCRKFKYDIYKYKPRKKLLFGKFKKEDFEI